MLPLIGALALVILAAGVVLFWLGSATTIATSAQTAADAAALAGEQELISELNAPATGGLAAASYDLSTVCARASALAGANDATLVSCATADGSGSSPYDLTVTIRSRQKLPAGQLNDGAQQALASARASDDAGAQASPTVVQGSSCVAGLLSGAPFTSHGGSHGFFPAVGADFTPDCEARLAGALDRLGIAEKVRLIGVTGDLAKAPAHPSAADTLEACGAAATVGGSSHLSGSTLATFDLTRPVTGQLNVIAMVGVSCSGTSSDSDSGAGSASEGNGNVHLVPLDGGPADNAVLGQGFLTGTAGVPTASQLQDACTIYTVWKGLNMSPKELMVALDTATTESTMGTNLVGDGSYGLFQQTPGDGWSNPQIAEPAMTQELNPQLATEMFLEGAQSNAGLEQVFPRDSGLPIWEIAQDVQASGAGSASDGADNYGSATNLAEATQFYNQVTGGQCH